MSAFTTLTQATSHARSILKEHGDDANAPGVIDFVENRLGIYPGPYRSAFRSFIEDRRKWQERKERAAAKQAEINLKDSD